MAEFVYDANGQELSSTLVEPGVYDAEIVNADIKQTRAGDDYIAITLQLDENGKSIFESLNINNSNETARRIAKQRLADYLIAGGIHMMNDTDDLVGLRVKIRVRIRKDPNGVYDDQNVVTSIMPINDTPVTPVLPEPTAYQPAPGTRRTAGPVTPVRTQTPKAQNPAPTPVTRATQSPAARPVVPVTTSSPAARTIASRAIKPAPTIEEQFVEEDEQENDVQAAPAPRRGRPPIQKAKPVSVPVPEIERPNDMIDDDDDEELPPWARDEN